MRRRILLIGLVLLVATPLMLALRGFAREVIVVPLLHLLLIGQIFFNAIPQLLFWVVFIAFALLIAMESLIRRRQIAQELPEIEMARRGRVENLARRIERAKEGEYFRWSFSRYLRELALVVLADRHRTTPEQIRQSLRTGRLNAPPEVHTLLQVGPAPPSSLPLGLFRTLRYRLRPSVKTSPPDPNLKNIVAFLEDQLDVRHDS